METNRINKRLKQSGNNSRKNRSSKGFKSNIHLAKIIVIVLPILFTVVGFSIKLLEKGNLQDSDKSQENSTNSQDNKTSEIHYYLDPTLPDYIFRKVKDIAQAEGWIPVENSSDPLAINIILNPSEPQDLEFHQFLTITKPWNQLDNLSEKLTIERISEKIDSTSAKIALRSLGYEFSNNTENQTELLTLQEVELTSIPLNINGKSPFDPYWWINENYPLKITVGISGDSESLELLKTQLTPTLSDKNFVSDYFNADKFLTIAKTGTSVAGGPGWQLCEQTHSAEYPIQNVKEFLNNSDLTIISNESSFLEGCSQSAGTTAFCGKPSYLQNLMDLNTAIISLTGNHMSDYGRNAFIETMQTYKDNNIEYFAAGLNEEEAWNPLIIDTAAGKIAFIGFNKMGPNGVLATQTLAGSAYYNVSKLESSINFAKESADLIWIDTHLWPEYGTEPTSEQIEISRKAIDLGADIVTGVSSHEIQAMEIYKSNAIFWGLGNFLFDQMWSEETTQGLVLKIYIYDKEIKHIEINPTKLYDYCQPRLLESEEKIEILEYFSEISGF